MIPRIAQAVPMYPTIPQEWNVEYQRIFQDAIAQTMRSMYNDVFGPNRWDDLRIEPVARTTGANAPSFTQWFTDGAGSRGVYLYKFDNAAGGSEKEIFFTMQMPHAWSLGSALSIHVHWIHSANQNTAAVRWGMEYTFKSIGQVFGNTTPLYVATNIAGDVNLVQYKHYLSAFAPIVPNATNNGLSAILIGRIWRDSDNAADTSTGDAGLLYIDAHYQIDGFGSSLEYTK